MRCAGTTGVVMASLVLSLCVAGNVAQAKDPGVAKSVSNVVVLQRGDALPVTAQKVAAIMVDDSKDTAGRSYLEILETMKDEAAKEHANIIFIESHEPRDRKKPYERIAATFYKVNDVRSCEKEITWNTDRKLTWNDFRGPMPADAGDNTAAATCCSIGFETSTVTNGSIPRVFVYNTFYTNKSWVRDGEQTAPILAHEQGHFDICELYTRMLKDKITHANLTAQNFKTVLPQLYNEVNAAYEKRQEAYERETGHGINTVNQLAWQSEIAQELSEQIVKN